MGKPLVEHKSRRGLEKAIRALRKLEENDVRLRKDASREEKDLVFEARATILAVMLKPQRYSQMRLAAATIIIDEVCGKLTDKLDVKGESKVEVIIHQEGEPDEDELRAAAEPDDAA